LEKKRKTGRGREGLEEGGRRFQTALAHGRHVGNQDLCLKKKKKGKRKAEAPERGGHLSFARTREIKKVGLVDEGKTT